MIYLIFKTIYKSIWKKIEEHDKTLSLNKNLDDTIIKLSNNDYKTPFNIYYDKSIKKRPTIIDIHGGGWCYGNKDSNDEFCYFLAKHDFNVVSLSYKYGYKSTLKGMIKEINELLNYLKNNNDKYNLDFSSIFMTGDSAGGELTFLYNAVINNPSLKEIYNLKYDIKMKAIALNHSACYVKELGTIENHKLYSKIGLYGMKTMFFGRFYKLRKTFKNSEPGEIGKELPPTLILTSTGDKALSPQSVKLHEDLNKMNVKHEYFCLENEECEHVFNVLFPSKKESIDFNNKIIDFFNKNK